MRIRNRIERAGINKNNNKRQTVMYLLGIFSFSTLFKEKLRVPCISNIIVLVDNYIKYLFTYFSDC